MAQTEGLPPEKQVNPGQKKSATESKATVRSSLFKYYIHDSVESWRIQLLGELSEAEVGELNGCWSTAKTTLANRKLLLDLRNLKKIDESGKRWIISMANEGAVLLPETFLRDELAGHLAYSPDTIRLNFFSRLVGLLRGSRAVPAPSSTQAQ